MKRVILGTAGHIDHGKTTLVKALTGTDTDRLPEEKARGITVDLGFAHLQLADMSVGIVDVPGHEGLIRNMLAGATGFDAVLLVVGADEGVMPQTREHFAIADLLGIERMVVAVTKADTVDDDWLQLVLGDVAEFLDNTRYADAPVVACSASTGYGLSDLRNALAQQLDASTRIRSTDVFRMPIDRVFTVRGTGTVVTGTVWSGTAAREAVARVLPGDRIVRIRGIQTHGAQVESAGAGERAAFAVAGVDRNDVARGQMLVQDAWQEVSTFTAIVRMITDAPLKQRQRVRVHLGTAEVMARVVVLGHGWIQLRLEEPVVARAGDRFVLRSYSPLATIGGGTVAELNRPRKRLGIDERALLTAIVDGNRDERVHAAIILSGEAGCPEEALPLVAAVTPDEAAASLAALSDDVVKIGSLCFSTLLLQRTVADARNLVESYHARHPLRTGIERAELLGHLPPVLGEAAILLAEKQKILQREGSVIRQAGYQPTFSESQHALRERILTTLQTGGLMPPTVSELAQALKSRDLHPVLKVLEGEGKVTAVSLDLYLDSATLAEAVATVRSSLADKSLPAAEFRSALPVSRKYLIPILEYLDRSGVTQREGDLRRVLPQEQPETA